MQTPEQLISQAESGDQQALAQLLELSADADVLRRFAASRLRELQVRAASADATPPDALETLAAIRDLGLRASLLERPALSEAALLVLADSQPLLPRILERHDCPVPLLEDAAASNDPELQRLAAEHPSTPDASIESLARRASDTRVHELLWSWAEQDPARLPAFAEALSPELRTAVAMHAEASPELIARLAMDTDEDVRAAVASRSDLDDGLAYTLAADPSPLVARTAERHPALKRSKRRRMLGVVALGVLIVGCAGGATMLALAAWMLLPA